METSPRLLNSVRFAVADVEPATKRLEEIDFGQALSQKTRTKIVICPQSSAKVLAAENFHSLIAAAFLAFKNHYPLVLSPDMLWQTVLQGVAQHINNHPEKLRHRLVFHETKIELVVKVSGLPRDHAGMLDLTRTFTALIIKHVPADKHFLFETEFSTTTDLERIAGAVAIMDAFQSYFDYVVFCICGIPYVTLEGSPEDWQILESKVTALHESDLELSWWTKHLLPLCGHFVRAARGDVVREHWQDICKVTQAYGTENLNGWLLKFIPYVKWGINEPAIHKNPVIEPPDYSVAGRDGEEWRGPRECTSEILPPGLARAPVICQNTAGESNALEFVAGFVGVTQSPGDLSLRPLIGWAICQGAAIDQQIARLRLAHETTKPAGMDVAGMLKTFHDFLPADFWRFYSDTDGAVITFPSSNQRCRLLQLAEIARAWDLRKAGEELRAAQKRGELTPNELPELEEINFEFGRLIRIADLGDGRSYVFGGAHRLRKFLPDEPTLAEIAEPPNDRAIFLWTGGQTPESFKYIARDFTSLLTTLLDGSCPQ